MVQNVLQIPVIDFIQLSNTHLACRNTAFEAFLGSSYQTVTNVPSFNCMVLGYPRSTEAPSSEIVLGADHLRPSSLIRI